jgi:hypothetical protein
MNYSVEQKDYLFYVRAAFGGRDDRSKVVRLLVDTGVRVRSPLKRQPVGDRPTQ